MNVRALALPVALPDLLLVEQRSAGLSDWRHEGMPRDGIVYVGYEGARSAHPYGVDGRAKAEKVPLGSVIDIYV